MTESVGACWDESPQMPAPPGQCAPMPQLCELPSGHPGAHKSGLTQWMHRMPLRVVEAERDRYRAALEEIDDWMTRHYLDTHVGGIILAMTARALNENGEPK